MSLGTFSRGVSSRGKLFLVNYTSILNGIRKMKKLDPSRWVSQTAEEIEDVCLC
jgi:hypothetical protein